MKSIIGIIFTLCVLAATHALANDQQGIYLGGGYMEILDGPSGFTSKGSAIEVGYDFNKGFGIEAMHSKTSDYYTDYSVNYVGLNLGHTFNTSWVKAYGKFGYAQRTTNQTFRYYGTDHEYHQGKTIRIESSITLGVGIRFTPFKKQKGLYVDINRIGAVISGEGASATMLGLGFKF